MKKTADNREYDVLVIGAGPAGLSAAAAAKKNGAQCVAVLERDRIAGGILNQCVHDGFGIVRYGAQLSGPEYAEIEADAARKSGVEILTDRMVTEITKDLKVTVIGQTGRETLQAGAIVLATGCRERTRGMLSIPGSRPAGIFTAGVAQNLVNRKNVMIGKRIVILGSGDIGLIMARRLTLEGAQVLCVAEIMPAPCGLARNVRQCLMDYQIPLYLKTTVSNIIGTDRLEAVELSQVDEAGRPIPGTARIVECDTLILSVGLIPENEVAKTAGVTLDPATKGPVTDRYLQTDVPGIFSCGNSRSVMDLADFVSEQGEAAGHNAAAFARSGKISEEPEGKRAALQMKPWEKNLHNAARKGMPDADSVTCTLCPNGCQVRVLPDGSTEGNRCPKGAAFALQEQKAPQRILTTTLKIEASGDDSAVLLPVRSDRPVDRDEMIALSRQLRGIMLDPARAAKIRRGDVLIENIGTGHVNIIAERGFEGLAR